MKRAISSNILSVLLALACLAFLIPLAGLVLNGTAMRLTGDDYCYRAVQNQVGFWEMTPYSYLNVSMYSGSRYSLTLFYALSGLFGPWANGVQPGLAVFLWLAGLFFLLSRLARYFRVKATRMEIALAAAVLEFFIFFYAPQLDQVVYWQSAMLTYTAPLIGLTFLFGLLVPGAGNGGRAVHPFRLAGLFLLAFVAGGFAETPTAVAIGILGLLLAAAWLAARPAQASAGLSWTTIQGDGAVRPGKAILAPTAASLAGLLLAMLVMFLSPTNHMRQVGLHLPPPPGLGKLVLDSLYNVRVYLSISVRKQTLPNLALALFSAGLAAWISLRLRSLEHAAEKPISGGQKGKILAVGLAATGLICVGLLALCMAPSEYGQSSYPIARALLTARWIVSVSIAAVGGWLGWWLAPCLKGEGRRYVPFVLAVILAALAFFPLAAARGVYAQTHRYQKWASFWDQRDQQIRAARAKGRDEIDVVQIDKIIPDVGELNPDPDKFYNNCAEMYYGMKRISADLPGWDP